MGEVFNADFRCLCLSGLELSLSFLSDYLECFLRLPDRDRGASAELNLVGFGRSLTGIGVGFTELNLVGFGRSLTGGIRV